MSQRTLATIAVAIMLPWTLACVAEAPPGAVRVVSDRTVEFDATITAAGFSAGDPGNYHLLVWRGGRAAAGALLAAHVADVQVLDALEGLGGQPGNGLGIDSWDDRFDPDSTAPDTVITGPGVLVEVHVPGADEPLHLADILQDPGARGFDMRLGGHRDNIDEWHSGCVVCLFSCPGSKVGNASYTVRDYVNSATRFQVRDGVLPADGTEVRVRLTLVSSPTNEVSP